MIEGWIDGQTDGWMGGWMGRGIDRQADKQIKLKLEQVKLKVGHIQLSFSSVLPTNPFNLQMGKQRPSRGRRHRQPNKVTLEVT